MGGWLGRRRGRLRVRLGHSFSVSHIGKRGRCITSQWPRVVLCVVWKEGCRLCEGGEAGGGGRGLGRLLRVLSSCKDTPGVLLIITG